MGRPRKPFSHGATGYARGCRCDECRRGHADYMREYTRKNAARINAQRAAKPKTEKQRAQGRERDRRWRERNPERARELQRTRDKRYYDKDPKAAYERVKRYVQANREKQRGWSHDARQRARAQMGEEAHLQRHSGYNKKYRAQPRVKALRRIERQRRLAREHGAQGTCTAEQWQARYDFFGGVCHLCGLPGADTIDHVKPLARGGSNWPANLRPAHLRCNSKKGHRVTR